jgi:hypothetical protein
MAIICNDLQPWGETVKSPSPAAFYVAAGAKAL